MIFFNYLTLPDFRVLNERTKELEYDIIPIGKNQVWSLAQKIDIWMEYRFFMEFTGFYDDSVPIDFNQSLVMSAFQVAAGTKIYTGDFLEGYLRTGEIVRGVVVREPQTTGLISITEREFFPLFVFEKVLVKPFDYELCKRIFQSYTTESK